MKNFWQKLNEPIYALAPMAGVTDSAFRQICKSFGADMVYSEMISATALAYGSKKSLELARFNKKERPLVIQLFGARPEHFALAAKLIEKKIKPDGIDINFGCPVKKVARQGAGAVLMNNLKLAHQIVSAVINNTSLPVSIKIRAKVGDTDAIKFLRAVKDLPIAAVMIHGRNLKQGHAGAVNWRIIKQTRPLVKGVLLANGGIKDLSTAHELIKKTQADGVGIGQGALGRPWVFKQLRINDYQLRIDEIYKIMLEQAKLAQKLKGRQGIREMRKHLCWYVRGLKNAAKLRKEFVRVNSVSDIKKIISN